MKTDLMEKEISTINRALSHAYTKHPVFCENNSISIEMKNKVEDLLSSYRKMNDYDETPFSIIGEEVMEMFAEDGRSISNLQLEASQAIATIIRYVRGKTMEKSNG